LSDATHSHWMQIELRRANIELEAVHDRLRSTGEELEATTAVLQSMYEELEATNEELEATNEELETMNEELEATNEELQTINEELRRRGTDLADANVLFRAIVGSLPAGIAVLDRELRVRTWNAKMMALSGRHPVEVEGRLLSEIDMGIPSEEIAASLHACLHAGQIFTRRFASKGLYVESVLCDISLLPLRGEETMGVIVLVEEVGRCP
jgi:two-component system, chemotaxis family, CheB/CheR fusion protein